jgi:hypothetical protein
MVAGGENRGSAWGQFFRLGGANDAWQGFIAEWLLQHWVGGLGAYETHYRARRHSLVLNSAAC